MAYTLSTVRTRVQQRIRDTAYSSSEIDQAINDTQNDVFGEYLLPIMRTSQDYTAVAGTADITNGSGRPTNFSVAIDLIDTSGGREKTIPYMDLDNLERIYPDPFDTTAHPSSYPQYWTWDGVTPKVFPTPAGAYTFRLRYYKKPTELVNDTDVPETPSEHGEVLVSGASYRILQVKDNYDQAAIHQNKYDELLDKFVQRYSMPQVGTPVIMPVNVVSRQGNF